MDAEPTRTGGDEAAPPRRAASIVLAAGAARRFGGSKQLALLQGRPLLEHALAAAAEVPCDPRIVVLGAGAEEIEARIDLGGATVVVCSEWKQGPGASLRAGLAALDPEVTAALVTLGDEPFVSPLASRRLLAVPDREPLALRAAYSGRPGHPVLIRRALFERFASAPPSVQPALLLRAAGARSVECGDLGDPGDVDTPEQLAAFGRLAARRTG